MPAPILLLQPNEDGLLGTLLLSPRGLTTGFLEFDVDALGRCDIFDGSELEVGILEARAIGSRESGRAILLFGGPCTWSILTFSRSLLSQPTIHGRLSQAKLVTSATLE